jgi:hypothetical protein
MLEFPGLGKNPGNLKKTHGNGKNWFFSKHMFKMHFKSLANK